MLTRSPQADLSLTFAAKLIDNRPFVQRLSDNLRRAN